MKGWLDNYNDSKASAPEGFQGDGFSNIGRSYSPAWKGQFQIGGKLKFLQPTSEKLPEGYRIPYSDPSSERAMSIGGENGEPAYLIPSFKYGRELQDPIGEFRKTGEHLGGPFKTWQEAEKWEKEIRHPAVERKENIMFPQEQFQMGGIVKKAYNPNLAANDKAFQKWYKKNTWEAEEGKPYSENLDYDFYSFYKNKEYENPEYNKHDHFPDIYKRPTHPTFSNESIYSTPENPGGQWTGEEYNPKGKFKYQLGGVLPGAVGNMYARTGAPSNGKYAKKTLPSAQDGYQTGDKVKYGTPEYREAYDKGEVVTKEGERSPILLDEVVVKGKKKDKNWLEEYRDKIVDENKDAGVLGAIIGTPMSAITSLPQLMGMKALTGEMERPSEGLGIENPYGAMTIDAIADPSNLIGLGALTKENIIAKLAASKESGLLSNTYKLNPSAFKYNPEAYYRTLGKEGLEDAFESGVIRPKQTSNVYSPDLGKRINIDTPEFPEGAYFNKGEIYSTKKMYNPDYMTEVVGKDDVFKYPERTVFNKNIRVAPKDIPVEDAKFYKKHWLQGYKEVPKQNNAQSSFIKQDLSEGNNIKYSFTDKQGNNIGTFSGKKNPEGIYVNGIEINPELRRQGLASKIYKDIAKDLQSKNEGTLFSRSTQHQFSDKDELGRSIAPANKLWENLVNKGEAEKFVEGMSHTYKIKPLKEGGVIKDDMGQWAHPGEITEIGSNNITMEGVPYDVLGISDTGDTKLMKPGKNYKFKGKKVTEYPMAKNGVNQSDENSLVKLDQLTNFTNYNTKQPGGWLDTL